MMIPTPGEGVLKSVSGLTAAKRTPLILDIAITAKVGEKMCPLPEGAGYPGFIFARGPDAQSVETALRHSHAELRFDLLQALPTLAPTPD
jgi:hypothetical protein